MTDIKSNPNSQFCNNTHVPLAAPACIALIATGSCPSPIDITDGPGNFLFLANPSILSVGSAPILNRKITGVEDIIPS